jgi:sigma-54 dependent transcriptional regulator, acetoin dehydrogenase operon transcriptional activator AcoR
MPDTVRELRNELIRVGLRGQVPASGVVSDLIVRSWRRSISGSVRGDSPCQKYQEVETDTVLCRAAGPILDRWQHHLADSGATLFLSDRAGSIVMRRTTDGGVRRRLDRAHAAEGFDYSEDSVGTNGLGTSMVENRAVFIEGSQHFNEALSGLACAAAPVVAPGGSVIGSISLGGLLASAHPLMLSLTCEIGQEIEERLRSTTRPEDLVLAMSFMRYANSKRPTVVMDRESLLANNPGLPYVNVTSHVMLWELLNRHEWSREKTARFPMEILGTEVTARRVTRGSRCYFVLHFDDPRTFDTTRRNNPHDTGAVALPHLSTARCGVTLVEGPRGSGRCTVAREHNPGTKPEVFVGDSHLPWQRVEDLLATGTDVLLCRIDCLSDDSAEFVRELLAAQRDAVASAGRGRLLITAARGDASATIRAVLDTVPPVAVLKPLCETPERIPGLVSRILDRVDLKRRHTMSPAALQSFVQWDWPGNIAELVEVVTDLVREVPASVIQRRHLPQQLQQSPPRRQLTMIEAAEREAILKALDAAGGNRSEAAVLLGIGRTTLYRRLKHFGLDADEVSL